MVALLLALGVAVIHQSARQGFLLTSVSAYYYTPAQAIFVGALIGLGACMIALSRPSVLEEVALNLGGMFAFIVAIVPTSRGEDYEAAKRACEEQAGPLLTDRAATEPNCPDVEALAEATEANVVNNMVALLVAGALALVAAWVFARLAKNGSRLPARFWWAFGMAVAVWASGLIGLVLGAEQLINWGHHGAAIMLLVCIIVVALDNALRREVEGAQPDEVTPRSSASSRLKAACRTVTRPPREFGVYAWLAVIMTAVAAIGLVLVLTHLVSLFWVEIVVALLFAAFWSVQTIEHLLSRAEQGSSGGRQVEVRSDA